MGRKSSSQVQHLEPQRLQVNQHGGGAPAVADCQPEHDRAGQRGQCLAPAHEQALGPAAPQHLFVGVQAIGDGRFGIAHVLRGLGIPDDGEQPVGGGHVQKAQSLLARQRAKRRGAHQLQVTHARCGAVPVNAAVTDGLAVDPALHGAAPPHHAPVRDQVLAGIVQVGGRQAQRGAEQGQVRGDQGGLGDAG